MRPNLLTVPHRPAISFDTRREQVPYFANPWHFHPELELNYILAGAGTRFIGHHVGQFWPGDIILLGSHLPHYWRCHPAYYQPENKLVAEAIVVRFAPDFLGNTFFALPETRAIQHLFDRAAEGLKIHESMTGELAGQLTQLTELSGFKQLMALLTLLQQIADMSNMITLSPRYLPSQQWQKQSDRMSQVMAYLHECFTQPIELGRIANLANMNSAAFCRYFRAQTGQTLTQFVTDLRIRYACELLTNSSASVTIIAEQVGIENVSHFAQTFRRYTQQTPLAFRQQMGSFATTPQPSGHKVTTGTKRPSG